MIKCISYTHRVLQHRPCTLSFARYTASFEALGVSKECAVALEALGCSTPTHVQSRGWPELLKRKDILLAAPTGTGKTLSYAIPTLQMLRSGERRGYVRQSHRPRALVLLPTRELALQVHGVFKSLSHHVRHRAVLVTGGTQRKKQLRALESSLDVLVGTPGRVLEYLKRGDLFLSRLQHIIIDEGDTLLSGGFEDEVADVLAPIIKRKTRGDRIQAILATATVTQALEDTAAQLFPHLSKISVPSLHRPGPNVRHQFIHVKGQDKLQHLLNALQVTKGPTLVFCNTLDSCRAVEHHLRENECSAACVHGSIPVRLRARYWDEFRSGSLDTAVCTDVCARGLDTTQVAHVVMFDFPSSPVDYLHRAGRTGREGAGMGHGCVTSLLDKKDEVLGGRIQRALASNDTLQGLSASKNQ